MLCPLMVPYSFIYGENFICLSMMRENEAISLDLSTSDELDQKLATYILGYLYLDAYVLNHLPRSFCFLSCLVCRVSFSSYLISAHPTSNIINIWIHLVLAVTIPSPS